MPKQEKWHFPAAATFHLLASKDIFPLRPVKTTSVSLSSQTQKCRLSAEHAEQEVTNIISAHVNICALPYKENSGGRFSLVSITLVLNSQMEIISHQRIAAWSFKEVKLGISKDSIYKHEL